MDPDRFAELNPLRVIAGVIVLLGVLAAGLMISQAAGQSREIAEIKARQQQMEKGVIRKLRTRGMFLPRERDQQLAAECYAQFMTTALPLTT